MDSKTKRFFRYLAPNLVTLSSLLFGMLSLGCSLEGRYADAAWFIVFSVLTDKLDGFVARLVKGTSEFGVQLDSFADFLNFGIAPATLWYAFLSRAPGLGFADGQGRVLLVASCVLWVLAVTFRLARYNIVGDDPSCRRVFFGVPTTLSGGTLVAFFLTCLKYGSPELQEFARGAGAFDEPKLLGDLNVGAVLQVWPVLILVGAYLMASSIVIPKLGRSRSKALTVFIFVNVFAGYALGFLRRFPEYLTFTSTVWIVTSLGWGQVSHFARSLKAPPIFPAVDPPPGKEPQRPEDDVDVVDDVAASVSPDPEPPAPSPRSARS